MEWAWLDTIISGPFLTLLGAAIAAGLSMSGSAKALGIIGEAANGVMVEQPEKFGITLLLQAIGTTQGIYGLLVTFLILSKSGLLTGATEGLTAMVGIQFIAAGLPIGIVGWYSAIAQARVAATSVAVVGKNASLLGKTFIYPAMVETFAVFSLLVSILMWNAIVI